MVIRLVPEIAFNPPGHHSYARSACYDSQGRPHVLSYVQYSLASGYADAGLYHSYRDTSYVWHNELLLNSAMFVEYGSGGIAEDANGYLHAVEHYYVLGGSPFTTYMEYFTNASGAWAHEHVLGPTASNQWMFSSLAVASDGTVHIAHISSDRKAVYHTYGQAGSWTTETVDTSTQAVAFGNPRMQVDANDNPCIGYRKPRLTGGIYYSEPVIATYSGGVWSYRYGSIDFNLPFNWGAFGATCWPVMDANYVWHIVAWDLMPNADHRIWYGTDGSPWSWEVINIIPDAADVTVSYNSQWMNHRADGQACELMYYSTSQQGRVDAWPTFHVRRNGVWEVTPDTMPFIINGMHITGKVPSSSGNPFAQDFMNVFGPGAGFVWSQGGRSWYSYDNAGTTYYFNPYATWYAELVEDTQCPPAQACPSVGIVARSTPIPCRTSLRGYKVPYAHMSGTFSMPAWLGKRTKIDSMSGFGKGDLKAKYVRSGGSVKGEFDPMLETVQSPGTSSLSMEAKETVCESLYNWKRDKDMDIRTQSCGQVDDPNNWDMIKRLCACHITTMGTSGETAYDPKDEGETVIKVGMDSPNKPIIIYPVTHKVIDLFDEERFVSYASAPVVAGWGEDCGYIVPATNGSAYPMYMAAYGNDVDALTSGTALLPYPMIDVAAHDNIVIAVLSDGLVYWSSDSGKTFYPSTGISGALVVEIFNYSNILVGCSGGIYSDGELYQSTDGGRTFYQVDPYNAVTGDVIAIVYHDDKTVYVLDNTGMVSVSDDCGETFIQAANAGVDQPTSMIVMDGMLFVGGYALDVPVVAGSENGGYTWNVLVRFTGTNTMSVGFTPKVLLSSCGCGVIIASVVSGDGTTIRSEVYRNVNWGATGCWERIWEDSVQAAAYNGLYMITDIACSCVNDILAVGMVLGDDPLYFGLKFSGMGQ